MNLETQPENEAMIRTLIALAHNMEMRVIVEGVESAEQLGLVRSLGADEVQGFFLGRPTSNLVSEILSPLYQAGSQSTPATCLSQK